MGFYRARHTRCAACGHEETLDLDWFERWSVGDEFCPGCRVDCTEEKATRVVADPQDPALDDALVARLSWWHTSSFPDWPSASFDPVARLTEVTRRRMGSQGVRRWAERQRKKALHVGTYEAAIHNLLRRISDQPEPGARYYLYQVKLRPDVIVGPGAADELVDWMGDVPLSKACPPGIDATRYVNQHEDIGGISLALGRGALLAVQRIELPVVPSPGLAGGAPQSQSCAAPRRYRFPTSAMTPRRGGGGDRYVRYRPWRRPSTRSASP